MVRDVPTASIFCNKRLFNWILTTQKYEWQLYTKISLIYAPCKKIQCNRGTPDVLYVSSKKITQNNPCIIANAAIKSRKLLEALLVPSGRYKIWTSYNVQDPISTWGVYTANKNRSFRHVSALTKIGISGMGSAIKLFQAITHKMIYQLSRKQGL